jgi:uncharacterized protein
MSTDVERAGPITSAERILYIDILRGMALFGILAANMRGFNAPLDLYGNIRPLFHGRADLIAQGFIDIFIQGKFVTLFSFLFGLGFAVQMTRAVARGAKFMSFYPRRLAALALFGLIHGLLIWWGDILLTYALAGTMLLFFRNRSQKTVLWWAGGIFTLPILVITGVFIAGIFGHGPASHPGKPFDLSTVQPIIAIYSHGSVPQILHENWVVWKKALPSAAFSIYALFLFLLGLWVYRSGIVERLGDYKPVLKRVCAVCLPLGIALNVVVVVTQAMPSYLGHPTVAGYVATVLDLPAAHVLSAGYASGLALLIQSATWKRLLTPFAAVGRMALTDYLSQSVLCTLFYYNYTTGLYGRVGPAMGLVATVVLYGAQVVFSNWWLARYRFGPMEWLWRGMTYGKLPSMRREPVIANAELPLASGAASSD